MTLEIERTIVLVGLMGAGKTTIGKRLADKLDLKFIDIDEKIEKQEGMKISKIFSEKGEEYFREVEKNAIAEELNSGEVNVMATGGGAFLNKETRKLIKKNSISVWLRAGIEMILERVSRNSDRPLLAGDNKREVLEKLIEERYPVYAEADLIVDSDNGPHYKVVDEIIWKL